MSMHKLLYSKMKLDQLLMLWKCQSQCQLKEEFYQHAGKFSEKEQQWAVTCALYIGEKIAL